MKTMILTGTLAAALLADGLITYNAQAADGTATKDHPLAEQRLERVKQKLGLTDDQAAQIKTQLKSEKDNLVSLVTHLHDARNDLRKSIQAGEATEEAVRSASAKVATAEADMAVERMKLHAKIMPILTTEQQKKLQAMQDRADKFVKLMIKRADERLSD